MIQEQQMLEFPIAGNPSLGPPNLPRLKHTFLESSTTSLSLALCSGVFRAKGLSGNFSSKYSLQMRLSKMIAPSGWIWRAGTLARGVSFKNHSGLSLRKMLTVWKLRMRTLGHPTS